MAELDEELNEGNRLALALVDHLRNMGGASSAIIPVVDRAEEYVVIVRPKNENDADSRLKKAEGLLEMLLNIRKELGNPSLTPIDKSRFALIQKHFDTR